MKIRNCVTVELLIALISGGALTTSQAFFPQHSSQVGANYTTGRIIDMTQSSGLHASVARSSSSQQNGWQFLRPRAPHTQIAQSTASANATSPANDQPRAPVNNGRSFRAIANGAKNILTGGFASIEQRAGSIFWFGSNLLATLIPLASLLGVAGETKNQTSSRRRSSAMATLMSSLGGGGGGSSGSTASAGPLQSRVEYVMGWLERSIEHLPNFPRLHPQECVKRSICEAHQEPERFGAIGLTLRMLFPATNNTPTDTLDNMEYKVINKYRHAAGYGVSRRLDNTSALNGSCKEKYEDCLVSLLEVGQNLIDFFLKN